MYNYNPLWKTLVDKGMKKKDLVEKVGLARGTVTKMGKNEPVSIKVIDRLCEALNVDISQIVSCSPEVSENDMVYLTISNENIGRPGQPEFREMIIARGTLRECRQVEEAQRWLFRQSDPDGVVSDVYVVSEAEYESRRRGMYAYSRLTPEERSDIIEVDGKRYIRKLYEKNHQ